MTEESLSLNALTELKNLRMQSCSELLGSTKSKLVFARTTALELLGIEKPRLPMDKGRDRRFYAIVPNLNQRGKVPGVRYLAWSGPIETQIVNRKFECTTPVCTWAHFAPVLTLEELVVLGESMMRRNRKLKRATIDDFRHYIDSASRFEGIAKCRLALRIMQEDTDSSQETRTRITLMRYGLPSPEVNHELHIPNTARTLMLDMAYPNLKIAIEYDGAYHRHSAQQVLKDDKRREEIESAGWTYVKVTLVDLKDNAAQEELAQRVATKMELALGFPVPLEPRLETEQICNGHRRRRKIIWDKAVKRSTN